MRHISTSLARKELAEVVNRVAYGNERVLIGRRGKELAAVISIADLRLLERLADEKRVTTQRIPAGTTISWFVFVVRLSDEYPAGHRDRLLEKLRAQGIGCKVYFPCIHFQSFYRERFGYKPGDFPVTEALSARTIALPFFNNLDEGDVDFVVRTLRGML